MGTERQRTRDQRVTRARRMRREMTDAERKLWWHLRDLPIAGTHFRRQATIGPYFADFACHTSRLVIEVDRGGHGEPDRIAEDQKRTVFLNAEGYRVLRFWNNDVLEDIDAVMEAIYLALSAEEGAPHP